MFEHVLRLRGSAAIADAFWWRARYRSKVRNQRTARIYPS